MKKMICLLLLIPFLGYRSFAQSASEKAVAAAVESLRKAMVDPDKAVLDKLTAEELSYGHSNGLIQTKQEFIDALTSGKSDFVSIDLTDQTIKIAGDNAIVRHTLSGVTNDGGKPGTTKLYVLQVWRMAHGEWKLLARQAAKVPMPDKMP
jgi:hypothetical protein